MEQVRQFKSKPLYCADWAPQGFTLAVCSFQKDRFNSISVISNSLLALSSPHPFPATRVRYQPHSSEIIATSADCLRLWRVGDTLECTASLKHQTSGYAAPLTALDWNPCNPALIITSSLDTTCTLWDVTRKLPKTQLIAHDRQVYDVCFGQQEHVFCSVGQDGSLRMFDLRALEHSTIVYETAPPSKSILINTASSTTDSSDGALLRVAWNKLDNNYLATFAHNSRSVLVLDIRVPAVPVATLVASSSISSISWAPHSSGHLVSSSTLVNIGDDGSALVWDLAAIDKSASSSLGQQQVHKPVLSYGAHMPVNSVAWGSANPDWIAITMDDGLECVRV